MTLFALNMSNDNRSNSPNTSPRNSPRPSPRPQHKREHAKSDTYLSVNLKECNSSQSMPRNDHSPVSPEHKDLPNSASTGVKNGAEISPASDAKSESTSSSGKQKKEGRGKKKPAWYNVLLYPTYKSRSEDFKHIFKDVPDDERLIVDYSCALQKEILVQGRLYVTQNFLCFYANIFGWETNVTLKWKDVTAMTKEKTALVIPNAILIAVSSERFFFTSFVAREKVYLMLFRVWQNALMGRQMNQTDMWQLVHNSYGAELGLTSDDEDYIAPGTEDDKMSKISAESYSEDCSNSNLDAHSESGVVDHKPEEENKTQPINIVKNDDRERDRPEAPVKEKLLKHDEKSMPTDMSDNTSDSDRDKESPVCTALHEGRQLLNEVIPIHVDQLFTLLFTNSKFWLDFHASRKTTDLTQTTWIHNAKDNTKSRVMSLTLALNQPVGPKTAQVTETQVMIPCSKAGRLYSIDAETVNAGVPYADSFCVLVHYCIHRVSENQTSIAVYGQIKYKKSVWGLVKGMIEKNCWSGLEDFYACLSKALLIEAEEYATPAVKRKSRRRRRQHSIRAPIADDLRPPRCSLARTRGVSTRRQVQSTFATSVVFAVLVLLVILNVFLYYRLWSLEGTTPPSVLDLQVLKDPPKNHDDWIKLLQKQETLHTVEMQKWQQLLKTAITLLKQTEESLLELQKSIHPNYTKKMLSIIESHKGGGPIARDDM
ncbi:protein Aster-B isoform X2 [Atheta coriaria]|uniref:protein Aster-B isoform X2 n=1 Tax=Dalotia coriaria TaxID=877792 RepID=UPI0031F4730E